MRIVQRVFDNVVVDTLVVPDDALVRLDQITYADNTSLTAIGEFMQVEGAGIGWVLSDGTLVPPALTPVELSTLKAGLLKAVDDAAEAERLKYITAGAGQAMTYQAKADEARRFALDASPVPTSYPLLAAEVGITAEDLAGVAAVVTENYTNWLLIGSAIEMARLAAKRAIEDAETADDARAAAAVDWPGAGG